VVATPSILISATPPSRNAILRSSSLSFTVCTILTTPDHPTTLTPILTLLHLLSTPALTPTYLSTTNNTQLTNHQHYT
jgi:hypothetical protein